MSRFESSTAVVVEHCGYGNVTLTVGIRTVARFLGDRKRPRIRLPFLEYSAASLPSTRSGTRKVTGRYVVEFAASLGVPPDQALVVVNEALAHLGWPEMAEEKQWNA
jgi:hypothetical protein